MKTVAPQRYAVRAVNQYRRRDVFPFLALRYYLNNIATRRQRYRLGERQRREAHRDAAHEVARG